MRLGDIVLRNVRREDGFARPRDVGREIPTVVEGLRREKVVYFVARHPVRRGPLNRLRFLIVQSDGADLEAQRLRQAGHDAAAKVPDAFGVYRRVGDDAESFSLALARRFRLHPFGKVTYENQLRGLAPVRDRPHVNLDV